MIGERKEFCEQLTKARNGLDYTKAKLSLSESEAQGLSEEATKYKKELEAGKELLKKEDVDGKMT
jgi:hypothetical protein